METYNDYFEVLIILHLTVEPFIYNSINITNSIVDNNFCIKIYHSKYPK